MHLEHQSAAGIRNTFPSVFRCDRHSHAWIPHRKPHALQGDAEALYLNPEPCSLQNVAAPLVVGPRVDIDQGHVIAIDDGIYSRFRK